MMLLMNDIFILLLNQEYIDFLCKDAQDYKDASEDKLNALIYI